MTTTLDAKDIDPLFGSEGLSRAAGAKEFPAAEMNPAAAYQAVADELMLDGNARQNLATFCQTWDDDYVHKLMDISINKNWIDKEEYPQSAAIDQKCVAMMADLWNAPQDPAGPTGTNTIGSSEACMLGGMAMKWRWRAKRKAQGKPADIGGYYFPDRNKVSAVMRPSATFNAALASVTG